MKRTSIIGACAAVLTAAQAHAQSDSPNTRTLAMPRDAVWANLVSYFTSHGIPLKILQKDSGVIYTENIVEQDLKKVEAFAHCDRPAFMRDGRAIATINVLVSEAARGQTTVQVKAVFREIGVGPSALILSKVKAVECTSTGKVEARVLQAASGH